MVVCNNKQIDHWFGYHNAHYTLLIVHIVNYHLCFFSEAGCGKELAVVKEFHVLYTSMMDSSDD